ncbi:MAG: hypothetical protein ACRDLM_11210 [Gaiellaceae bacterium]
MLRVAAIAAIALVVAGCGGGKSGPGYNFTLPADWHQLSSVPAGVDAAYERNDTKVVMTIRKNPRVPVISHRFIHSLDVEFGKRLKGYVPLADRIVVTKAGPVFFFAYTQKNVGRLTSIVLVPAHGFSYVLYFVSDPRSKAARQDMAEVIHSFAPTS